MDQSTKYKNATDFRKSLEARLESIATKTNVDLQRLRRKVAFDRFLARIFSREKPGFYLKGGYAMELRFAHARATRDIDLTFVERIKTGSELINAIVLNELRNLAQLNLNDHFIFHVGEVQIDLENAPYGGARYPVTSMVDSRVFVRFQLDVGADAIVTQTETLQGTDWLGYCGIPSPIFSMISVEQQFAEKLHAYTLPRQRPNTRVKDLVDMALLVKMRPLELVILGEALNLIFKVRSTHSIPQQLDPPPQSWDEPYQELARECALTLSLTQAFTEISNIHSQLLYQTVN